MSYLVQQTAPAHAEWRCTAEGLWLARRDGRHLGSVERRSGARWFAFDQDSEPLGVHRHLAAAQGAVQDPTIHRAPDRAALSWGPLLFVGAMTASAAALLAPWSLLGA